MVANSITGCVPLLELAYGWTILHDPAARVVFACRHHMGSGACRAQFHQFPRVCAGPAYRYGRRLFGRRSAGQAFDACVRWIETTQRPYAGVSVDEELEARVELHRLMETL